MLDEVVDDTHIKILTPKVSVPVGRQNFKDTIAKLKDRNVKSTAPKVEDGNFLLFLLIQSVGQSGSGGLVDYPFDFQPGNLSSVFGGLPLTVVKVGRYGNDRLCYRLSQEIFGIGF